MRRNELKVEIEIVGSSTVQSFYLARQVAPNKLHMEARAELLILNPILVVANSLKFPMQLIKTEGAGRGTSERSCTEVGLSASVLRHDETPAGISNSKAVVSVDGSHAKELMVFHSTVLHVDVISVPVQARIRRMPWRVVRAPRP
jgi:hypothetical protein